METRSNLLFQNGLPDLPVVLIEPHRNREGIWRIKFSFETEQPLSMTAGQASEMASDLKQIGEEELADEISDAVKTASRYATM